MKLESRKSIKAFRVINRFLIALIFIPAIGNGQSFGTSQSVPGDIDNERIKEIKEMAVQKKESEKEKIEIRKYDGSTQIRIKQYSKVKANEKSLLNKEGREILRLVREIEKDIGETFPDKLDFKIHSIDTTDPNFSDNIYRVYFYQYIDSIRSDYSVFEIDGDLNVEQVSLQIFDPDHPNTNQILWIDKKRAKQIAIQEMRGHLSSGQQAIGFYPDKVVDDATIYMPAGTEQEGTTLKPVYIFLYEDFHFQVIVDALTGEPEFRETSFQ